MSKFTAAQKDTVRRLAEAHCQLADSERNQRNLAKWERPEGWNRDLFRGFPRKAADGAVPFMAELDTSQIAAVVGMDLRDYYSDSYTMLTKQLEYRKYRFDMFPDDFPYTKEAYIWFGVSTELGMFDTEITFYPNKEPWVAKPAITCEEDLEGLALPDFYKSAGMKRIHSFYEDFRELLDGTGIEPMFPSLARAPFCVASHLCGLENMLMNMLAEPEFAAKTLRMATDFIKSWETERVRFTGQPLAPHKLFNDEIDCPMISPAMYRDMILPLEKELSEFFGGVSYWHSCGSITQLLGFIGEIPGIEMFHVGPWTDLKAVCEIFPKGTKLDVCLKPEDDVYYASEAAMREKLRFIRQTAKDYAPGVRADVFQRLGDWQDNLKKIRLWIDVAREELG